MLFHTWPFAVFLLLVLPIFYALRKTRLWLPWLMAASYFFYGWWNPYYLGLVLYVTVIVFAVAALIDRPPDDGVRTGGRGWWLFLGAAATVGPLLFFKYGRFIEENVNAVLGALRLPVRLPDPAALMPSGLPYLLPIGISFFTFQSLGYLVDLYLGKVPRERNLFRLAGFVCFFPQLLAGPIERAGHLLPQLARFPAIRLQNFTDGLSLLLLGLFKKVAVASYLALYVDRVYDHPEACGAPALVLATIAFGWQLFFDFGGYTDMARGVAKLMGFHLVLNFNHPYLADSVADFWRRWHISFSRWILDYIFMPLQMRWRGWAWPRLATAAALLVTFLFSGIWHGSAWTFVVWGGLHGLGLVVTRELERSAFYRKRVPRLAKQAAVFLYVSSAWIFFRADSLPEALRIVGRIFAEGWQSPNIPIMMVALVVAVWAYQALCESRFRERLEAGWVRVGLAVLMALCLWLGSSGVGAFIYFQF
jgi:D-alanyl-lipoteichoic acid acyltransferase DltB (MBOAT superfamily)